MFACLQLGFSFIRHTLITQRNGDAHIPKAIMLDCDLKEMQYTLMIFYEAGMLFCLFY